MSLDQYKDANRKELWEILQIQVERIAELEELVVMAYEMNTDSYTDIYSVKWLANRLAKELKEQG